MSPGQYAPDRFYRDMAAAQVFAWNVVLSRCYPLPDDQLSVCQAYPFPFFLRVAGFMEDLA